MAEAGRERELKLGIPDRDALESLVSAAGGTREAPVLQLNHFFDTPDRALGRRAIGLRIREEGGRHILTVKGPTVGAGERLLSDRIELEATIPSDHAVSVLAGERAVLSLLDDVGERSPDEVRLAETVRAACGVSRPERIGSFSNERTRVSTLLAGSPVVLEFDHTRFTDDEGRFEVELELTEQQSAQPLADALEALFERAGVRPVPTTSKLGRFVEILEARGS